MGKVLPKRKFFKSSVYSHVQNGYSHIDSVRDSLENLIFSNEREVENSLLKKRIKVVIIVTLFLMVIGSLLSPKGRAEVATFYPTACLGGWVNPRNAEGEVETTSNDIESNLTKENSAILPTAVSADIYCGNFKGQIEENTKPTKILVSLAWGVGENIVVEQNITGDSFASSSGEILDVASTTEVSFTFSSSTNSSSTEEVIVATSTETIDGTSTTTSEVVGEEPSLITKVIDVVGEVIRDVFGEEENKQTPSVSDTPTLPQTEEPATPSSVEVVPEPAPAVEPTPATEPAPASEPVPVPQSEPTSFLPSLLQKFAMYFVNSVFAEEVATSSIDNTSTNQNIDNSSTTTAVTTPEIIETEPKKETLTEVVDGVSVEGDIVGTSSTSTIEIDSASTTESTSTVSFLDTALDIILDNNQEDQSVNNFLEVLYTFDGVVWKSLGKVNESSMKYRTFEIPVTATTSWNDMNQLQIKVQPLQRIDVTPTVYLDGIKVEVLYETPVIHPHPDFSRDTILKDKSDEGVRVVSIINSDTNINEIWYTTVGSQGDYGVAPGSWVEVRLDQASGAPYKLIDIYGQNIFWADEGGKMLWVTNLQKSTNDGIGLVNGASTTISFTKSNEEEWLFEYNSTTKAGIVRIKN